MNKKPQIFLLHFAGGSCYSYTFLKKYLENNVTFLPLELPGRGNRMSEELIRTKSDAVKDLLSQLRQQRIPGVPYFIYGHSMGAILGLDLAKAMEELGDSAQLLMVTGNPGPGIPRSKLFHNLERQAFKEGLKNLGGIADEILENEEVFQLFEPVLRADFQIIETINGAENLQLEKTPILAIMGTKEPSALHVANWRNFTKANCADRQLEGGHFFILDHPEKLAEYLLCTYDRGLVL